MRVIEKSFAAILMLVSLMFAGNAFGFSGAAGACTGDCRTCHTLEISEAQIILDSFGPSMKATGVKQSPSGGLWEVTFDYQGHKSLIYVDFEKKHILRGSIMDIKTRTDLTDERLSELNKIDVSKISLDNALVLGDSRAPIRVVVFDDPV